jgi:predicted outer membrane protein
MGKAKLGSWWAAGAAVCMLVSAGVAAQSTPADPVGAPAPAAEPGPAAAPASAAEPAPGGAPEAVAPAPAGAPAATRPAPVAQSRYNERGGGDQAALTALHRQSQQTIVDAQIAEQRGTTAAVRDYAATIINNTAATDAKMMSYAQQQGMNVDSIRLAPGALPNGALTRVDLVSSPPDRFDADFAAKMVANSQAALDQTQKAQALARAPGMAPMLRQIAPVLLQQQADAMALAAALPTRPSPALQLPGEPSGVSRTNTGVDTRRGVAP